MVRTRRVGKKRPFWRGFFLTIVTLGIYGVYWAYQVFHELHEQFDLDNEGLDDGIPWLVVGVLVPVVFFVYFWKGVGNLQYVRQRMGLEPGISPGRFVGAQIAGASLPAVLVLAVISAESLTRGVEGASLGIVGDALLAAFVVLLLGGQLVIVHAYYLLQTSINETWDAWYGRLLELRAEEAQRRTPEFAWTW